MPTLDEALIEDTFALIKQFDDCTEDAECARLQRLIEERAERLGLLTGYVVKAMDGEPLVACLDEEQARAIQTALLLVEGGMVTEVAEELSSLIDFVHPDAAPEAVAFGVIN